MDTTASGSHSLVSLPQRSMAGDQVFANDELVAFRYRIVRLLGSGGMGEVYEAEDLELRERVALKVLRRELAERPGALELLKREVALARKVSHPHVCRLFDVGFHLRSGPEGSQRICFLTMELLQGESLSALLRRNGPLAHNEALCVARQLAEGLAAAHAAGILHRDLKSANVLLVPSPAGGAPRAVITDFGLARAMADEDSASGASGSRFVGTPAYMAPEQVEGGTLTHRSDLYALGVLLFELLTGTRPFQGLDDRSTALQRLHARAPAPRTVRPELAPRWDALILRCLERHPKHRFPSARALITALPEPLPTGSLAVAPRSRGRTLLVLLALGLQGLLAGGHASPASLASPASPASSAPRRAPTTPSATLLGFTSRGNPPGTDWLPTILTRTVLFSLRTTTPQLRLSPEGTTQAAKTALSLKDTEALTPESMTRLRELLGCAFLLQGEYTVTSQEGSPSLQLQVRILDTATGGTVALLEESAPLTDVLQLGVRTGERVAQVLGFSVEPVLPVLQRGLPSSVEALQLYSQSLEKLRQRDSTMAQALLERALALEPDAACLHAEFANALILKGERTRGREELGKALRLLEGLPPQFRLSVEAAYHGYASDWRRAAELNLQLFELLGRETLAGIAAVNAQLSAREPEAALATVAMLRETAPPIYAAQLDSLEAKAALNLSDFPRAQAAAARAVSSAEALKDEHTAATSLLLEADAWSAQGHPERALEALRDAVKRFQRSGNRLAEADATSKLAEVLSQRDLRGRLQAKRAALALYQEAGSRTGMCMTMVAVSDYARELGELREALRSAEASLPLCRDTQLPVLEMHSHNVRGQAFEALGNLTAAEAAFREQLRLARKHQMKSQVAISLTRLADVALSQRDTVRAREHYTEAQGLLQGSKNPQLAQHLMLELRWARLAWAEGKLAEASQLADQAAASVAEVDLPEVQRLRARILLAEGKYPEAHAALLQAGEPTALVTQLSLRIQRALLSARRGGLPERQAALERLREVLSETQRIEWLEGQYEAGLALAEVEWATGQKEAGRARLKRLERGATKSGWGGWAQSARVSQSAFTDTRASSAVMPQGPLALLD